MADFDALFVVLEEELAALKVKFLDQFLPAKPEDSPEDFEYEVKSYSLLAHAAFEEFIEAISEAMMSKIEGDLLQKRVTLATACFLTAYGLKLELSDVEDAQDISCFEHIRNAVAHAKALHSKALMDNHGFSAKYMRKLLIPVGINMPRGEKLASLKKLAEVRGSFAHTMAKLAQYGEYKRAKRPFTPEEAFAAATDCKEICLNLKESAKSIW